MHRTIARRVRAAPLIALVTITSVIGAQDKVQHVGVASRERRVPDVMYVPTPHDVAAEMLKLADVSKQDVLYDLGCGDGRIVVLAAKRYGCRAVGIDIDPLRVADAKENVRKNRVGHLVTIQHGDIFEATLGEGTVVTLYLSSNYNTKLLPQLTKLKPGSRIVSHQFGMGGLTPDRMVSLHSEDGHKHDLFLWKIPRLAPSR
jgi:precorrin-6B methylase 2